MIRPASTLADFVRAEQLIREYIGWLPFDLDFQDFETELADLADHYAAPDGTLLLAYVAGGPKAVGIVGVRRFDRDVAELKRMYVQPAGRGSGLGRELAETAIDFAKEAGYQVIRLDSDEASMPEANTLYEKLGFVDIEQYRPNHLPCARFMEKVLKSD
ncbi:MAG: GNAT family N-acetyltransferase [Acidimicrobiia bacterium]|nr:GNAT family N-acetyltransferase [Acidimicrobiia bacterium]